jgi:hypothetical protein
MGTLALVSHTYTDLQTADSWEPKGITNYFPYAFQMA